MDKFTGYVKFYNSEKGYGFIKRDGDGKEIFFHYSELGSWPEGREPEGSQNSGDRVEFEVGATPKGDAAKGVTLLGQNGGNNANESMDQDDEEEGDMEEMMS